MEKILHVNLSEEKIWTEPLKEEFARMYLGGNGFAARILYDEVKPKTDPFDPENRLIFFTGPANGTIAPMAAKFGVACKSPGTNTWMDTYCSGSFGYELKYAGYDCLVISGKSKKPVYLFVNDDKVEIRDACKLWGRDTFKTQFMIKNELKDDTIGVACIGVGGENLVRYACIISDQRAAGAGGAGAVMGSKNLKAVAARGTKKVAVPDFNKLVELVQKVVKTFKANPGYKVHGKYGSGAGVLRLQKIGALPTNNWREEVFDAAEEISAEKQHERYVKKNVCCISCFVPCSKYTVVDDPNSPYYGAVTVGPEYEGQYGLGTVVGNRSLEALIKADQLSDYYGLGQISAGVCIAFAMECYEKGLISRKETDGLDLRFGNHEALIEMLRKIAYREGLGDILAEGVKAAAEKLGKIVGKDLSYYALEAKGMEVAGHSPRSVKSQAIGWAITSKGSTHMDVRPYAEESGEIDRKAVVGKGKLAKDCQDRTAIEDSLIICRFEERVGGLFLTQTHVDIVNLVTEMGIDLKELIRIAERINLLERAFNLREGFRRKDDTIPERFMEEPIPKGLSKGMVTPKQELDIMLDEYYEARGCDKRTGIILPEKLRELGVNDVARDMEKLLKEEY